MWICIKFSKKVSIYLYLSAFRWGTNHTPFATEKGTIHTL
nr:MAG TPA: hypothetical protein [Caudoviricetes sp.]